jgi:hypothetical protein
MIYVIYAPDYNTNIGGVIVLHKLCHLLNQKNEKAVIWPYGLSKFNNPSAITFITNPVFNTPLAKQEDLDSAIVIYPEVVDGNPLSANKVIRWFLHKPGYHTGRVDYGSNELYFFYQEAFNDESINKDKSNLLKIIHFQKEIYYQKNFSQRDGVCYLLRKGKNRTLVHNTKEAILIDNLSHNEIAEIFNKCERFISYDLYSMYSEYAAVCGCISIVVPEKELSKTMWLKSNDRPGIAYGFQDIEYALTTRKYVKTKLEEAEDETNANLILFIKKSKSFFCEFNT